MLRKVQSVLVQGRVVRAAMALFNPADLAAYKQLEAQLADLRAHQVRTASSWRSAIKWRAGGGALVKTSSTPAIPPPGSGGRLIGPTSLASPFFHPHCSLLLY